MTSEWIAAIASVATFAVIAVGTVLALVQLRHLRNSNQIAVFTELRHKMESIEFQHALRFIRYQVPEKLNDPAFRFRVLDRDSSEARLIAEVGSFLDSAVAPLVKHGIVDRDLARCVAKNSGRGSPTERIQKERRRCLCRDPGPRAPSNNRSGDSLSYSSH